MHFPNTLIHPVDNDGCGFYRIVQPGKFIHLKYPVHIFASQNFLLKSEIEENDIKQVITQRMCCPVQASKYKYYSTLGCRLVMDLDDLLWNVPANNPFKHYFKGQNFRALKDAMQNSDLLISSTEPLKLEMQKLARNVEIKILPNLLSEINYCETPSIRKDKLRIGWAGSATHYNDLSPLFYAIKSTLDRYQWVFFGYCPEEIKPFVEFHEFVPLKDFHFKLRCLNLDLALAPLDSNLFNECKSNLKLLEFSALSIPCITTDIYPYQENPNVKIKSSKRHIFDWINALEMYDKNEDIRQSHANIAYQWALKFQLEKNAETICNVWF